LETAKPDDIYQRAQQVMAEAEAYPGFIVGTAVVPFGTPTENMLAIKQACLDMQ